MKNNVQSHTSTAVASELFKQSDASSYDPVTEEFERFTGLLTSPLAEYLAALAELTPGQAVLDVGSGTGVVALAAASRVGTSGRVVGIDLSVGMLVAAQAKVGRARLNRSVEFRKMDAERLEISDAAFDVVLSLFALFHFPDPLAALNEMFRVLRPGGKLVVGVGSGAPVLSARWIAHRIQHLPDLLRALLGKRLTAPDFMNRLVDEYLQNHQQEETDLAKNSHRTSTVPELVRSAGFTDVRTYWMGHEVVLTTAEEFWDVQRTFSSKARKRLAGAPPQTVETLRMKFLEKCRSIQSRGGSLVYPVGALCVVAQRPI